MIVNNSTMILQKIIPEITSAIRKSRTRWDMTISRWSSERVRLFLIVNWQPKEGFAGQFRIEFDCELQFIIVWHR